MSPLSPRSPGSPEQALLRALRLALLGVAGAGVAATVAAALLGGGPVAAGVGIGGLLGVALLLVTRGAVLRAARAEVGQIALWVLLSYAAKFVLVVVAAVAVIRAGDAVDRKAFALTLLVAVVVSVTVQALLTGARRTATVAPVSTVADSSYDDDSAARVARAAAGAAPHPGTVPPA